MICRVFIRFHSLVTCLTLHITKAYRVIALEIETKEGRSIDVKIQQDNIQSKRSTSDIQ